MDFDPNEREGFEQVDAEFLKKFLPEHFMIPKISWWTRVVFWFSPIRGAVRLAKELGMPDGELSAKAHALFLDARRVDIVPSRSGMRGFRIVLNNMLSIFFSQDGDHFVYDGFEMGPHEGGEVTIFDGLDRLEKPCNKPDR